MKVEKQYLIMGHLTADARVHHLPRVGARAIPHCTEWALCGKVGVWRSRPPGRGGKNSICQRCKKVMNTVIQVHVPDTEEADHEWGPVIT